jgi:hypothetical protein
MSWYLIQKQMENKEGMEEKTYGWKRTERWKGRKEGNNKPLQ